MPFAHNMRIPALHRPRSGYSPLRPRDADSHTDVPRSSSEYGDIQSPTEAPPDLYSLARSTREENSWGGANSDSEPGTSELGDALLLTKKQPGMERDHEYRHNAGHAVGRRSTRSAVSQYITNLQERTWNNGITCMHVSGLIFSLATLCVKLVGSHIPAFEIVLARCSLSLFVNVSVAASFKLSPMWGQPKHWFLLGLRGLLGMSAMTCMYFAVSNLPMPDAVTIVFTNPAVTALLAWIMLREQFGWRAAVGCVLSLVGVALVARPPFLFGSGGQAYGAQQVFGVVMAVVSSACTALSFICVRVIGQKEPSLVFALWQHAMSFATSAIPLALGWPDKAVAPSLKDATLLAGVGFLSFISQVLTNRAFQLEPAGKVASINLMQVLYSYVFELSFFHANFSFLSTAGSLLVACGVVVVNTRGCCMKQARTTTDDRECLTQPLLHNGMNAESCAMHEGFMTQPLVMSRGSSHTSLAFPQILGEGMGPLDGPGLTCVNTCTDEVQVNMARNRALSSSVLAALMENADSAALAPATPCCLAPAATPMAASPSPALSDALHLAQPPRALTTTTTTTPSWATDGDGELMQHLTQRLAHPSEGLTLLETMFDHAGQKLRRELDAAQGDPHVNPWLAPFLRTLIQMVDSNQQVTRQWRDDATARPAPTVDDPTATPAQIAAEATARPTQTPQQSHESAEDVQQPGSHQHVRHEAHSGGQ